MPLQQNQVHFVVGKSLNFVKIYVSKLQLIGILIFLNGSAHIDVLGAHGDLKVSRWLINEAN
jgi:hypothetical protein